MDATQIPPDVSRNELVEHGIYAAGAAALLITDTDCPTVIQRLIEIPYAVAMRIDPSLWGINEIEQQYLQERWGVRPGPNPDAPPAAPAAK